MSNASFRNHWFPMGLLPFVMAVFLAALFSAVAYTACWFLTKNLAVAIISVPLVFGLAMFLMRCTVVKRRVITGEESDEPLEDNLFMKEWVLYLSVTTPDTIFPAASMVELERQLYDYHERAQTAVTYFSVGRYRIGCDGSMRKITDTEEAELLGCQKVVAQIYFEDLPSPADMERCLAAKPSNFLERGLSCVPLDIYAYGTFLNAFSVGKICMAGFAVRNGEVIVESLI